MENTMPTCHHMPPAERNWPHLRPEPAVAKHLPLDSAVKREECLRGRGYSFGRHSNSLPYFTLSGSQRLHRSRAWNPPCAAVRRSFLRANPGCGVQSSSCPPGISYHGNKNCPDKARAVERTNMDRQTGPTLQGGNGDLSQLQHADSGSHRADVRVVDERVLVEVQHAASIDVRTHANSDG